MKKIVAAAKKLIGKSGKPDAAASREKIVAAAVERTMCEYGEALKRLGQE